MKNKTLLLPDFLTKLEEEEIKANYPYPVKVLPENEIIEIIKEKNPSYAYAYVNHKLNSCGTRFNHLIVDCETGALLLFDKRNGVSLGTSKYVNISDDIATIRSIAGKGHEQQSLFKQKFIKAKQLKKYAEIINGKYDNKVEEEEAE